MKQELVAQLEKIAARLEELSDIVAKEEVTPDVGASVEKTAGAGRDFSMGSVTERPTRDSDPLLSFLMS